MPLVRSSGPPPRRRAGVVEQALTEHRAAETGGWGAVQAYVHSVAHGVAHGVANGTAPAVRPSGPAVRFDVESDGPLSLREVGGTLDIDLKNSFGSGVVSFRRGADGSLPAVVEVWNEERGFGHARNYVWHFGGPRGEEVPIKIDLPNGGIALPKWKKNALGQLELEKFEVQIFGAAEIMLWIQTAGGYDAATYGGAEFKGVEAVTEDVHPPRGWGSWAAFGEYLRERMLTTMYWFAAVCATLGVGLSAAAYAIDGLVGKMALDAHSRSLRSSPSPGS